jgi:GlpG protein
LNWIAVKYFPLDQDLSVLSGYLRERGLQHRIAEENGQQCLSVMDAAVIPALQEFLDQYLQGRVELHPAATADMQPADNGPTLLTQAAHVPVVVCLIILSGLGALVTGTALSHYFTFQDYSDAQFVPWAESFSNGEIWRLLTPAFLHSGIIHFLFNSLWMWELGRRLEFFMGRWHFLLFFVVTAIAANIAQYLWYVWRGLRSGRFYRSAPTLCFSSTCGCASSTDWFYVVLSGLRYDRSCGLFYFRIRRQCSTCGRPGCRCYLCICDTKSISTLTV